MDKLFALFAFLASLAGCDGGRQTLVQHIAIAGDDVLLSRATVEDGVARFECLRSATGACHYLVLPRGCVGGGAACLGRGRRYDVAAGDARQVAGLHAFRICVGTAPATACRDGDALGD